MKRTLIYTVPSQSDGIRLESFLMGMCGFSRRIIRELKQRREDIQRNGAHIRMVDPVFEGDRIVAVLRDTKTTTSSSSIFVPVLYEDDDLVI